MAYELRKAERHEGALCGPGGSTSLGREECTPQRGQHLEKGLQSSLGGIQGLASVMSPPGAGWTLNSGVCVQNALLKSMPTCQNLTCLR